jgi:ATP-dependent DNA helicase RecG
VRELKTLKLLEGRAPNYLISSKVAVWADQKARYIRERGMNDKYYQDVVLQYLQNYGQATRQELDDLLMTKLPEVLDMQQRANKIKNLLQVLRRTGKLQSTGKRPQIMWRLTGSDKTTA